MRHAWIVVVLAGLAGLGAGAGYRYWSGTAAADGEPADAGEVAATDPSAQVVGERRPAFELALAGGGRRSIAAYDGRVVLLNFWATWCPPCVEEMPALDALQDRLGGQGLQVVGVAIDPAEAVRAFAAEHGIDYPLLAGTRDAFGIARAYGNARGTLPYTVVIDRDGIVRATHLGPLTQSEAAALVQPYLE